MPVERPFKAPRLVNPLHDAVRAAAAQLDAAVDKFEQVELQYADFQVSKKKQYGKALHRWLSGCISCGTDPASAALAGHEDG